MSGTGEARSAATEAYAVWIEKVDPPRQLTDWECEVIELLAPNFGRAEELRVYERCGCGCASVSFRPSVREHHLLGEAKATDVDGMTIWVLLFGQPNTLELDELEIQRADGQPIVELPPLETLGVVPTG